MPEPSSCTLKLRVFEGPLDLLLHLIRVNELNIHDIPIVEITRQYDEYLALMRELDLIVAGDYLLMAATLLHIKSKTLLPKPPPGAEAEGDPRAELVQQLLDYEKLNAAAESLRSMEEAREDYFSRPGDPLDAYEGESLLSVSLFDLMGAFKAALERYEATMAVEIAREEFSIEEKVAWLLASLEEGKAIRFQDLISSLRTRAERVVTFLALLEVIRLGCVLAAQRTPGSEILLMRRPPSAPGQGGLLENTDGAEGIDV